MVNISTSAITGIRDPEREGFIASTLFSQGWNITLRALDFDDIWKRCQSVPTEKPTENTGRVLIPLVVNHLDHRDRHQHDPEQPAEREGLAAEPPGRAEEQPAHRRFA